MIDRCSGKHHCPKRCPKRDSLAFSASSSTNLASSNIRKYLRQHQTSQHSSQAKQRLKRQQQLFAANLAWPETQLAGARQVAAGSFLVSTKTTLETGQSVIQRVGTKPILRPGLNKQLGSLVLYSLSLGIVRSLHEVVVRPQALEKHHGQL